MGDACAQNNATPEQVPEQTEGEPQLSKPKPKVASGEPENDLVEVSIDWELGSPKCEELRGSA